MSYRHTWIVFKKEFTDIFRDRRTWIASVLIPVLIFPVMFYLMGMGKSQLEQRLELDIPIFIDSAQQNTDFINYMKSAPGLILVQTDQPREDLLAGKIKTIVVVEASFAENISRGIPAGITLLFDEVSDESGMATSMVERAINVYSDQIRNQRLEALGIPPELIQPTLVSWEAYVPEGREARGGMALMMLTFLLPFLLMLYPVVGGMPAAIDLGSGEKERMSLEPLLSTGADRLSILLGKYLTILLASIIGVLTSLLGIYAASLISPDMLPTGVSLSLAAIAVLIGVSLSIAMILSGVMLSISVFAKSYKEAGTYLGPISIFLMIPTYLTMFSDIRTIPTASFFVPFLNSVLLMKEVLVDIINPLHIAMTFGVSALLVVLSLWWTKYMFSRESVIFRS